MALLAGTVASPVKVEFDGRSPADRVQPSLQSRHHSVQSKRGLYSLRGRRLVYCAALLAIVLAANCFSIRSRHRTHVPPCTARDWAAGSWVEKDPPLRPNSSVVDVFAASGFEGCAQMWFKPHWYLGSLEDVKNMGAYRWNAAQWRWQSDSDICERGVRLDVHALLYSLVHDGGWFLLGDSLAEQHFFSLACILYPHVVVRWGRGTGVNEQNMYLSKDSPLVATLDLPLDFPLDERPLVTNFRTDHGANKTELAAIYAATPESAIIPAENLFTTYPVLSPPINASFDRFFDPASHYRALIFSTAAHYTPREFAFPTGWPSILSYYEAVVRHWSRVAADYLAKDKGGREVIVRGASSGHSDCHAQMQPYKDSWPTPVSYNWAKIPLMNAIFEEVVGQVHHPRLSYLPIERPAQLRPDGHTVDCLHYAVGTGVLEGWTAYLDYFLRYRKWSGARRKFQLAAFASP